MSGKYVDRTHYIAILNDGTEGNYGVVRHHFKRLGVLRSENPKAFGALISFWKEATPFEPELKAEVNRWAFGVLGYNRAGDLEITKNAQDVLELSVKPTLTSTTLRKIFGNSVKSEGYKLVSPFRDAGFMMPAFVAKHNLEERGGEIHKPLGQEIPSVDVVRPNGLFKHIPVTQLAV